MIRKRANQHYEVVVYAGRDPFTGKERRVSRTVRGRREDARAVEAELLLKVRSGELTRHTPFAEVAEKWCRSKEASWSPKHRSDVRRELDLRILPALGTRRLTTLTPATLVSFYEHLRTDGCPPSVVMRCHRVISAALTQACRWQLLDRNPATHVAPSVPRSKERVPPGPAELTRLLEFADPDFALFLRLAIVTGARRGEVLALRWRDVDEQSLLIARALTYTPERGVVEKDPKGHRARRQGLDPRTRDLLAKHALAMHERAHLFSTALTDDAFVFSAEPDCSAPWHPDTVSKRFERLRRRAKVQCTLHDLRHAAMTLLIAGGVDVKAVQQFAGHAHASLTLDVYAHHQQVGTRLAELLAGEIDGVTDPRAS